tara:strand:- start:35 stop:1156 length:1122 start_codon:yes stop_codon:yes gene_type:complete
MKRIEWVDTIKAIGMIFVFYGHYVERISHIEGENGIAMMQFKFIYSFHMPLFFILSGFFAKKKSDKKTYIKKLFFQRIIPVFSFAILFIPLWLMYFKYAYGYFHLDKIINRGFSYLGGNPKLDFMTWFLVCLFTAELIAVLLGLLSNSKRANLIKGLFLVTLGYLVIENISTYSSLKLNFWYIHESIIALGFYLIGNWLFPILTKIKIEKRWLFFLLVPSALLLMKLSNTFIENDSVVIMAISKHGDFLPFVINSLLGIILIISLGMIIPPNKIMSFIGNNTLILLGLNGVFFHFINSFVANGTFNFDSWWIITINCILVSLISIAICYPIILFINKYLPQLFGKPYATGPILKPLNNYSLLRYVRKKDHVIE